MRRGSFYQDFPATAILLLVITGFYAIQCLAQLQLHGALDGAGFLEFLKRLGPIDAGISMKLGALRRRELLDGESWRLISHAFLHGFIFHILINAWILADIGRVCEPLLGRWRFTVAYIACAIAGGLGSVGYDEYRGVDITMEGASGAIAGLIGVLLAYSIRHRIRSLRNMLLRWIVIVVVISVVVPMLVPMSFAIGHAAHAGGFIAGLGFGAFTPRNVTSHGTRPWKFAFNVTVLLALISLALALWNYYEPALR